jgi:threonyl-tRNA synthetase
MVNEEYLHKLRHSAAHVMAQSVQELFPGAKLKHNNQTSATNCNKCK